MNNQLSKSKTMAAKRMGEVWRQMPENDKDAATLTVEAVVVAKAKADDNGDGRGSGDGVGRGNGNGCRDGCSEDSGIGSNVSEGSAGSD